MESQPSWMSVLPQDCLLLIADHLDESKMQCWALCSRRLRRWVPRDLIRNIVAADWPRKGAFYTRPRALTKLVYRRASGIRPELCDAAGFSKVIKRVRLLVKKNPNLQHVHLDTPLPTDMISNILAFLPRSLTFLGIVVFCIEIYDYRVSSYLRSVATAIKEFRLLRELRIILSGSVPSQSAEEDLFAPLSDLKQLQHLEALSVVCDSLSYSDDMRLAHLWNELSLEQIIEFKEKYWPPRVGLSFSLQGMTPLSSALSDREFDRERAESLLSIAAQTSPQTLQHLTGALDRCRTLPALDWLFRSTKCGLNTVTANGSTILEWLFVTPLEHAFTEARVDIMIDILETSEIPDYFTDEVFGKNYLLSLFERGLVPLICTRHIALQLIVRNDIWLNWLIGDATAADSRGMTLLHYVCLIPHVLPSLGSILLSLGANPNARNEEGKTPFDLLIDSGAGLESREKIILLGTITRDAKISTSIIRGVLYEQRASKLVEKFVIEGEPSDVADVFHCSGSSISRVVHMIYTPESEHLVPLILRKCDVPAEVVAQSGLLETYVFSGPEDVSLDIFSQFIQLGSKIDLRILKRLLQKLDGTTDAVSVLHAIPFNDFASCFTDKSAQTESLFLSESSSLEFLLALCERLAEIPGTSVHLFKVLQSATSRCFWDERNLLSDEYALLKPAQEAILRNIVDTIRSTQSEEEWKLHPLRAELERKFSKFGQFAAEGSMTHTIVQLLNGDLKASEASQ